MAKDTFPFFKQLDRTDCGPVCLKMIAHHYGKVYSTEFLREKCYITREGVSVSGITDGAESIGMRALPVSVSLQRLKEQVPLPCIAYWRQRHFIVVYGFEKDKILVADPDHGKMAYTEQEFLSGWAGNKFLQRDEEGLLILLEPGPNFANLSDDSGQSPVGFKFLFPYFKPYKRYVFQLFLGLLVGSVLQLAFPFLTQSIVDYGIRYQNINFIYLILIGQITLFVTQTFLTIIRSWILVQLGSRINIAISSDFLSKLTRLPLSFFDSKNTGDIMQRVEDNKRVENFLSAQSLGLVFSVMNSLIFLAILFYYHVIIGAIFLTGSVAYSIWIILFSKKRARLDYQRFDESSGNSSSLIQIISGIQEIKLNGSEKRRRWEWESIQVKLYRISMKGLALANYQTAGGFFINEIKNIVLTFFAAKSVIDGELTLGMMLAIQYIIGQLNAPLNGFIAFIQGAQDAKISLERIGEIHNKETESNPLHPKTDVLPKDKSIHLRDVVFHYGGPSSARVLNNLNLVIPEGKVTAIVGASGSGKTTLLKLLLGLYNPTSGSIQVGNVDLKNIDLKMWRANCGVVMQDGYIFTDSILRNITESDSEKILDKARLRKAIDVANIEEFVEALPAGYNSRIGVQGTSGISLSGGQKQRILIARAIYKNPDFLFFDEATSSLDANNEKKILEGLDDVFGGKTVLVIAHRLSTVKRADQIIVMEKGKVIEVGTHSELTTRDTAYLKLVKNQLELGN